MLWCRCGVLLVLCVCPLACLVMSPCPPGCCCPRPSGLLVLCESLGLRSLPRSVPLSTSALSVARNQLCDVDHLLRPFSRLQQLSLSHNLLARVPRGLPPSLESLLLRENRITYITAGALRQLGNLTRLDLEGNRIRAIQPGALLGLGRLRVLTLRGNELASLPAGLPPSLTHLDLSANCLSALDPPSLAALVNLQALRVNGNCLRSVPDRAFDGLPRLRSVDLAGNLWACGCDILYLYRWLLGGGPREAAADLVCAEPAHLAHRLLLNLSAVAICPRVLLTPSERERRPERRPTGRGSPGESAGEATEEDAPRARVPLEHYTLETLTYEECLLLNQTQSASLITTPLPDREQKCQDSTTGRPPPPPAQGNATSAEATRPPLSTHRDAPGAVVVVVVPLLAALCALVALLLLLVLLVLRQVLLHRRRVAPLGAGSAG